MNSEIQTEEPENRPEAPGKSNQIACPDCETQYPKPRPGTYRCTVCYCKFEIGNDASIKIIPFFEEMHLEPFLVMLGVLGIVMLFAMDDAVMPFSQRIQLFLILVVGTIGVYKLVGYLCRRYRRADRFFRRFSRVVREETGESGLIEIRSDRSDIGQ